MGSPEPIPLTRIGDLDHAVLKPDQVRILLGDEPVSSSLQVPLLNNIGSAGGVMVIQGGNGARKAILSSDAAAQLLVVPNKAAIDMAAAVMTVLPKTGQIVTMETHMYNPNFSNSDLGQVVNSMRRDSNRAIDASSTAAGTMIHSNNLGTNVYIAPNMVYGAPVYTRTLSVVLPDGALINDYLKSQGAAGQFTYSRGSYTGQETPVERSDSKFYNY